MIDPLALLQSHPCTPGRLHIGKDARLNFVCYCYHKSQTPKAQASRKYRVFVVVEERRRD